ncbi:MAG: hypothetical protein ABI876_00510 [Bacteroidota bacterium]
MCFLKRSTCLFIPVYHARSLSGPPLAAFGLSPGPLPSWGYGVAANLGGSIGLGAGADIFLELTAAAQNDLYMGDTHGMLLPTAGLAWRF